MKLTDLATANGIDLLQIDVVAFDVFDTVLFRRTSPMTTHQLWAKHLKELYHLPYDEHTIVKKKFANARLLKLKSLLRSYDKEYKYDDLVRLLYKQFEISESLECFRKTCVTTEYEIESETTFVPKHIIEWIKELRNIGKQVICVSDYYLPSTFIDNLFKTKGVKVDSVFVSTDYLKQKRTGNLYKEVIRTVGVNPNKILMIGDNYESDVINARKAGLMALYVNRNRMKTNVDDNRKKAFKELEAMCHFSDKPFGRVAFLMFVFIDRLYYQLKSDTRNYALFMSREGEFFKKLFDAYQKLCVPAEKQIRTHYFYVSRRATLIPSVHAVDNDAFKEIYRNYGNIRPSIFFKNLQLDDNVRIEMEFADILENDKEIQHFSQSDAYQRILGSQVFIEECTKKALEQRDLLKEYIRSFGEKIEDEGLTLVDVGYGGTAQNNLYRMYNGRMKINGYYMISRATDSTSDSTKKGIIFDANSNEPENIFTYNSAVIEMLCLASHCGVDAYQKENGSIVPIFHHKQEELDCYQKIVSVAQRNIMDVFCRLILIVKGSGWEESDYLRYFEREYHKFIFNPTKKEMDMYLKIPFEDNFAIYRTYKVEKTEKNHKLFSIKGLTTLLSSRFRALKSQNTHWIAAAAYKLDIQALNYIMSTFPVITMKGFNLISQRERKKKGL